MPDFDAAVVREIREVFTKTENAPTPPREMRDRPSYGFSVARSGKVVYRCDGKEYVSDPGHILIYPKGASYTFACVEPGDFTVVNFDTVDGRFAEGFEVLPLRSPEHFLALCDLLEKYRAGVFSVHRAEAFSVLYSLLAAIEEAQTTTGMLPIVRRALDYIEEHYAEPDLSVCGIAAALGISEIYLRKLLTDGTGLSPLAQIRAQRMRQAQRMLLTTDRSVGEIARACGFGSIYHFCRTFKSLCGTTPTVFRQTKLSL